MTKGVVNAVVNAGVTLGAELVAIITPASVKSSRYGAGEDACAVIKASSAVVVTTD